MWHSAWKCPYKERKLVVWAPRKPLKREADKTRARRLLTTKQWHQENPPDKDGYWYCYIPKHPLCPKRLTSETLVLEHDQSKARRKDLQFIVTNIHPACSFDNKAKGSLSAEEYMRASSH